MRIRSKVLALLLLLALVPGLAVADSAMMEELGSKAAEKAMQRVMIPA